MGLPATAPKMLFGTMPVQREWGRQVCILCSFAVFFCTLTWFFSKFVVGIFLSSFQTMAKKKRLLAYYHSKMHSQGV
jgi:hypothetical protein